MKQFILPAIAFLFMFCGLCELGFSSDDHMIKMKLNRIEDMNEASENSLRVETLARFAVQEHNKQQNSLLEFTRVVKAREQVVAGKLYHLTLEAIDAGKKKIYEAKVWVKPWMNFTQLEEFKLAHDCFAPSDLGVKQEEHGTEWKLVPVHVTEVQDAANHVVQSLQEKSNSLSPYKLQDIVLAKAKVIEDYVKFQLLLKVKRGIKEEMFRAEVNKNIRGKFFTSHIIQDHS